MPGVLRLVLVALDIAEEILDGKPLSREVTLAQALEPFPVEWQLQPVILRQDTTGQLTSEANSDDAWTGLPYSALLVLWKTGVA